jgi:hypothetical protein
MARLTFTAADARRGALIYGLGDAAAALILGQFSWLRLAGMALLGGTVYAFEVPNYFRWIDRRAPAAPGPAAALRRTVLALLYFNPLWIARHLAWLAVVTGRAAEVGWPLLGTAARSFAANVPLSLLGNYVIQNKVPLRHRFLASALFSALMAVYYAVSAVVFGR